MILKVGIVRHIAFLDDDFKSAHPEMPVEKKSDSPDEDKSIGDSSSLKPVLSDYFAMHPHFHPDTFLGDSSFDTIEAYRFLKDEFHFSKALIPYNPGWQSLRGTHPLLWWHGHGSCVRRYTYLF